MNLKEMGVSLRHERERQGLTIDEVIHRTKISKTNIIAMEEGDADMLPHPVYAKGFARNYAKLLGLDPETYADAMGKEFVAEDNVSAENTVSSSDLEPSSSALSEDAPGKSGGKVLIGGLLVLALCIGGVVFFFQSSNTPEQEVPAAPAVEEPVAPAVEPEPMAQPEEAAVESAVENVAPALEEAAAAVEEDIAEVIPEVAQEQPVANGDNRQRVVVRADETCWVYAVVDGGENVDGGVLVDVTLKQGQSKLIRYHKTMKLKLGNAGGVHLQLNGKDYPFDAQSGQVKTLEFTAQ